MIGVTDITRMTSSVAWAARSGRWASRVHWSGCFENWTMAWPSWPRVVSWPPRTSVTTIDRSSWGVNRSSPSKAATRRESRSSVGRRRDAEQVEEHRRGIEVGEVGHELAVAGGGEAVDEAVDEPGHAGPDPLDRT